MADDFVNSKLELDKAFQKLNLSSPKAMKELKRQKKIPAPVSQVDLMQPGSKTLLRPVSMMQC